MAMTEASSVEAPEDHHSFMDYWRQYHDGSMGVKEIMRIPRAPEFLDEHVPNPEEFSQPIPGSEHGISYSGVYKRGIGVCQELDHSKSIDERLFRQFEPTIELMLADAEQKGIHINDHKVVILVRQGPADKIFGDKPGIMGAHVDSQESSDEKIQLLYLVSDYKPTSIYEGKFDDDLDSTLDRQKDEAKLHTADPYQIAVLDDTVPHEVPPELASDPNWRTFIQVRINTPNPYDQYLVPDAIR